MTNGVVELNLYQAKDIGALNRSALCAADVNNGSFVVLTGTSATAGQTQVWTAVEPSTSAGLTGLWMAAGTGEVVTVSGSQKFKNIDPDPRNATNLAAEVFHVIKPKVGDIITFTEDCFAGSKSTNTFVNATDSTGGYKLVWGSTQTSSVTSFKLLETTYISIPSGSLGTTGRVTAYRMVCVGE